MAETCKIRKSMTIKKSFCFFLPKAILLYHRETLVVVERVAECLKFGENDDARNPTNH